MPQNQTYPYASGASSAPAGGGQTQTGRSLYDRVPPHDSEAEKAVLGGMLMSKEAVGEVSEMIKSDDFYEPQNQMVYDTILDLYSASQPTDVIMTVNELTRNGGIEKVGGSEYVHSLVESVPTAANASFYANIVREQAILRNVIETGTKITQLGYSADGSEAEDIVNLAQAQPSSWGRAMSARITGLSVMWPTRPSNSWTTSSRETSSKGSRPVSGTSIPSPKACSRGR